MVFTGGEALLRSDMITILEHAVGLGIRVELLTNGIIVDDELAGKVVSAGISQVTLSFDGINAETHDRFRGESGYHDKTSSAVSAFREQRDKSGKPLRILLKTVISRNSLAELEDIALFVRENGFEVQYQPIEQNYGEESDPQWFRKSALWIEDVPLLRTEIGRLKQLKSTGAPIVNSIAELETFVHYFEQPEQLMDSIQGHDIKTPSGYCRHALTNFVISSNGDVRMCFKMEPIGNLVKQQPDQMWANRSKCWAKSCLHR